MWKLQLPDNTNSMTDLITALTYVNGTSKHALTEDEKDIIKGLYLEYESLHGTYSLNLIGDTLSNETNNAIHDGYSEVQEEGRLKDLRSRLMLQANRCPCCGINAVTDMDHHLPRSVFKALAVYSSNLVPLCHKCNNKKRVVTGEDPEKRFVHVYYDNVPDDIQFFKATSEIVENGLKIKFFVEQVNGISDELFQKLKFQVKKVKLNKRLQKEINIFLLSFVTNIENVYIGNNPSESVKVFLEANHKTFKNNMGLNDWRTVLLNSLANNDTFCNGGFRCILSSSLS